MTGWLQEGPEGHEELSMSSTWVGDQPGRHSARCSCGWGAYSGDAAKVRREMQEHQEQVGGTRRLDRTAAAKAQDEERMEQAQTLAKVMVEEGHLAVVVDMLRQAGGNVLWNMNPAQVTQMLKLMVKWRREQLDAKEAQAAKARLVATVAANRRARARRARLRPRQPRVQLTPGEWVIRPADVRALKWAPGTKEMVQGLKLVAPEEHARARYWGQGPTR